MKIHVLSDIHLEFAPFHPPVTDADVVVLAGDIGTGPSGVDFARTAFADQVVVYVFGNHELYGHALPFIDEQKAQAAARKTYVGAHAVGGRSAQTHVLENDVVVIGGVRFVGCTLWTDFALHGPDRIDEAMVTAELSMSDFRLIHKDHSGTRFRAHDAAARHVASRAFLDAALAAPFAGPTVVVTHHVPHPALNDPRYADNLLSAAFVSDCAALLDGRAALWISGHTHHNHDVVIGGTRCVSNQRGYPGEEVVGFDPGLVVEV